MEKGKIKSRGVAAGFAVLALVHAPAALGAVSSEALVALYGQVAADPAIRVMLQHRGALFALVTLATAVAVLRPGWRIPAAILAGWSMLSFLGIYFATGAPDGPLRKIALADGIGIAVLSVLAIARWPGKRGPLPGNGVEVPEVQGLTVGEGDRPG